MVYIDWHTSVNGVYIRVAYQRVLHPLLTIEVQEQTVPNPTGTHASDQTCHISLSDQGGFGAAETKLKSIWYNYKVSSSL